MVIMPFWLSTDEIFEIQDIKYFLHVCSKNKHFLLLNQLIEYFLF